jgi:hypothetical protein
MQSTHLEATEETKAQVRATIETYAALRKAGDVEGLVDLFTYVAR